MSANLISTPEAAALLSVAETTIKRWADENILRCARTPGGHRKFVLEEIVRFAEANGYALAGSALPPMIQELTEQVQIGVFTRRYERIAEALRILALTPDRQGILALFLYLYKHHIPLAVMMDEIVRPAFHSIGQQWQSGDIDVAREHAAYQAAIEALIKLSGELRRKKANHLTALCACPEGEYHELGLRGLAYTLEGEGWAVDYMGANTPFDTLASSVQTDHPELICLSVTMGSPRSRLLDGLSRLSSVTKSYQGKLIVGGILTSRLRRQELACDHLASSIQDTLAYAREIFGLKPGPKGRSSKGRQLSGNPGFAQ